MMGWRGWRNLLESGSLWLLKPNSPVSDGAPLTMAQDSPPLTGLSPVAKKPVVVDFDGAAMSSDAGLMVLREVERRMGLAVLVTVP